MTGTVTVDNPVDVIKRTVKLSSFAASFGTLKSIGDDKYRTKCFVHGGDNPTALMIDDNNNMWHCFGCGEGGSIFDMWMGVNQGKEFGDALEAIASQYNVELPERESAGPSKRRLYDLHADLAEECMDYLLFSSNNDAKTARRYLKSRGVGKRIIEKWMIGFMPENDEAIDLIDDISNDTAAMDVSNIIRSKGSNRWCPFAGRILFPIIDQRDNVLGFGARQIDGVECFNEISKYVNSPETSIYSKGRVLYGMNALPVKVKDQVDRVVISEGYFDVIAITESTDENTVAMAACGTALGTGVLPFLQQGKNLSFVFDGDSAGQKAAVRSFWVLNHVQDCVITASVIEGDQDPWDVYRDSPARLSNIISRGLPLITMAVKSKWELLGNSTVEMNAWVKSQASSLTFNKHRELFISDAARILGQQPFAYKRNLALPARILDDKKFEKEQGAQLSHHTAALISMLLTLPSEDMSGILAPLHSWGTNVERVVQNWLPAESPIDVEALHRLSSGIDAQVSHSTEIAIGALYPKPHDDENPSTTTNIRVILAGMIRQMLHGIGELTREGAIGYLENHISILRRSLETVKNRDAQPTILAYLIDCALDIDRVSGKIESASAAS